MKPFHALGLACWMLCAEGCAGRAIDLDNVNNAAPPAGSAGAGFAPEVAQVHSSVDDFWADDSRIYWRLSREPGSMDPNYGCVFSQCASTQLTYGTEVEASTDWMLPLGDDILFAWGESVLVQCPKTGCVGAPTQVLRGSVFPGPVSDGSYLYWQAGSDLYRCPAANCGDIPELVARRVRADDLHVQGGNVYWTSYDDPSAWLFSAPVDGSAKPSGIVRHDADGAPPLTDDANQAHVFTVDSERVYWLDTDFQVRACSSSGCRAGEPVVITTNAERKGSLFADETGLYWIGADSTVLYCPSAGCAAGSAPTTLSTTKTQHFRVTPSYVYWATGGAPDSNSALFYRTPKPNQHP